MARPKIIAHCLVKNEEKWVWYAIKSVLNYVDKILVWDTGSTDSTVDIIQSISDPKISFKQIGEVDINGFTKARQQMLDESSSADWIMLLDGDEIWPTEAIQEAIDLITNSPHNYEYLVNPYYNLVGDVYHYQNPKIGEYHIGRYSGNITIRFINIKKIQGLHYSLPYGKEGLFDSSEIPIQDRSQENTTICSNLYLHATHLRRSSYDNRVMQRKRKYKYEIGLIVPDTFLYPHCFYLPNPNFISSLWKKRDLIFAMESFFLSPLIHIKRKIFS